MSVQMFATVHRVGEDRDVTNVSALIQESEPNHHPQGHLVGSDQCEQLKTSAFLPALTYKVTSPKKIACL